MWRSHSEFLPPQDPRNLILQAPFTGTLPAVSPLPPTALSQAGDCKGGLSFTRSRQPEPQSRGAPHVPAGVGVAALPAESGHGPARPAFKGLLVHLSTGHPDPVSCLWEPLTLLINVKTSASAPRGHDPPGPPPHRGSPAQQGLPPAACETGTTGSPGPSAHTKRAVTWTRAAGPLLAQGLRLPPERVGLRPGGGGASQTGLQSRPA